MARRLEYIIHGPPATPDPSGGSPVRSHRSLSLKKDTRNIENLRALYRNSSSPVPTPVYTKTPVLNESKKEQKVSSPTTPALPPTPPVAEDDVPQDQPVVNDTSLDRSALVTPVHQNSPPTPEKTPPRDRDDLRLPKRPFLSVRPSIASTRAESFKTAREDIFSDNESEPFSPGLQPTMVVPATSTAQPIETEDATPRKTEPTPLITIAAATELPPSPEEIESVLKDHEREVCQTPDEELDLSPESTPTKQNLPEKSHTEPLPVSDAKPELFARSATVDPIPRSENLQRNKSLRERLEAARKVVPSSSTEKFASIIGWSNGVSRDTVHGDDIEPDFDRARWSGVSTGSAVEAYVVDSPLKRPKRGTLRKVHKNDSLRVASSPLPESKRSSLQSNSDSPHRLIHKSIKLNNSNRWSLGSDFSRSMSLGSSPAFQRMEVIKVAVIPERNSSRYQSANNSRRHSHSVSTDSSRKNARKHSDSQLEPEKRKRAYSQSEDREKERKYPPHVPARSSSLSAPTSRRTSRANSVSSEHVSVQRQQAEKDLRTTLDRMESERLASSLRNLSNNSTPTPGTSKSIDNPPQMLIDQLDRRPSTNKSVKSQVASSSASRKQSFPFSIQPGTKEWADLRPATITGTPFSHISAMSASPEIIEAKAVNLFPHNNDSVQLIEPNRLSQSPAVRELRKQHPIHFSNLRALEVEAQTPPTKHAIEDIDSPLRNPRSAPNPPEFNVIPASPAVSKRQTQIGSTPDSSPEKRRGGSLRLRPAFDARTRSESFAKQLVRNFSTRKAVNLKADQNLDGQLHPFWRPRAFWDDEDHEKARALQQAAAKQQFSKQNHSSSTSSDITERNFTVKNSLGIPQSTSPTIVTRGRGSILRRLSARTKLQSQRANQSPLQNKGSYSSLQRIRASRKLYKSPTRSFSLNLNHLRVNSFGWSEFQDRFVKARAKREDERREQRREALRRSIGQGVISQGDSRFPASIDETVTNENHVENAKAERVVQERGLRM